MRNKKNYLLKHIKLLIIKQYDYTEITFLLEFSRGIGTRGHRGTCPPPPLYLIFFKGPRVPFNDEKCLFVQIFAANTNLRSMVPFEFPKHTYALAFDTLACYVVIGILTPKMPFLCPKHIAVWPTTRCRDAIKFMLIRCS